MITTEIIMLWVTAHSVEFHESIVGLGNIQGKSSLPSKLLKPRLQQILPGHLKGRENAYLFGISIIMDVLCLNREPVLYSLQCEICVDF